ncbi:MAG: tryptophan 7-halogenase [Bacteroidetes bacterium]|nr:tryptophan 7-halogenase [Bacteroidota bacterium]HET6244637.1 NAD(P)/FAD-dependent oxidoreductase [Bacteroidia bacterium]
MKREQVDVLVIGAGPSGTVAASMINKEGFKVKIVEKLKFPRFVIGESLLPRCMEALEDAGFIDAISKKGFQEKFGAKFVKDGRICDFNFSECFTQGSKTWTWQVQRAEFDRVLSDEVQRMGVPIDFETGVTEIKFNGTDSVTTVEDSKGNKKEIAARFIVDASGYGRVIPKLFNLDRPSNLPPRKTWFSHIKDVNRDSSDEPNRITIVLHQKDIWIWIIPFSNGITSVGFVGIPEWFEKFNGNPEEKLRAIIESDSTIKDRFRNCEFVFEPRTIEGWSMSTDKFFGNGFVLTGNVTEFLDPVFSSGVTLATVSGHRAAQMVCEQLKGQQVNWQKDYTDYMMQGVDTFRSYVMGWYDGSLQDIFFAKKPNLEIQKQICSVLAGYVWDTENPYVKNHKRALQSLAKVLKMEESDN